VRVRTDLVITSQRYEGYGYAVVKDPVSLRYFRFDQYDHYVLNMFDGRHTLEQVQEAFEERFAPKRMTLEQLEAFTENLLKAGLLLSASPTAGDVYYENFRKKRMMKILQRCTNILYIEIPLFDPDALLGHALRWFGWLYRPLCVTLAATFMASAVALIILHWDTFLAKLPSEREFFSLKNLVLLWVITGIVKTLHEFSHGLCCKSQGGEVHDMGFLLMCLTPCFYMNVTDAWTLPNKWRRIAVDSAGVYMELILAAAATWIWWHALPASTTAQLSLSIMTVCGINTLLFNGNPLLRFDGYYVLSDWIELPNLRDQSNQALKRTVAETALGIEYPPERPLAWKRWVLFVVYAIASYIYSWFIMFWAIWGLSQFLKPYNLGSLSMMLAWFAVIARLAWPVCRFGKSIYDRGGRLPEMKLNRVTVTCAMATVVLLLFFFLPLPISRVRQSALVQVRPEDLEMVFVPMPATLEILHVRDGQQVAKDTVLAELRNRDLENRLEQSRTELAIRKLQIQALRDRIADTSDVLEKSRLAITMSQMEGERRYYALQVGVNEKILRELTIRAPRSGVVTSVPRVDEVGKLWDKKNPLCSIGDPTKLRALLPVEPDEFNVLKHDWQESKSLAVTMRVQGWENRTWPGRITMLPENEAKNVPLPLTVRGGGPVPIVPHGAKDEFVPQSQNYLVGIDFVGAESDGIWPGTMAQAKVHTHWRSCSWWLWRKVCLLFGIGF
jgi:putative peptide zinc metalloprotease protein